MDAQEKKMHVWQHNSHFGKAAMAKRNMEAIIKSPSTTLQAKDAARRIINELAYLNESLKKKS